MKIHTVEQGSKEWQKLREGKITSTSASTVVGYRNALKAELIEMAEERGLEVDKKMTVPDIQNLLKKHDPDFVPRVMEAKENKDFEYKMIAIELGVDPDQDPEESSDEQPFERGHRLEPEARSTFEEVMDVTVEEVGFATLDEEERIGVSPDGFIKGGGHYVAGFETKAPCNWKYVKYWLEDRIPDEYKEQMLQYLVVGEKMNRVYLMLFNPLIEVHPYHIYVMKREDVADEVDLLKNAQLRFWKEHDKRMEHVKEVVKNIEKNEK